ncbi:hypothetical protein VJ923_07195 [Adlercreutzia sp. R25]|uniref:hypothetical protein n=1 Tax=Adlercreutzia shanghongiae TaxID=3111773 RepID=UPI002DBCF36F|nr:hypothetical protein [Adlercreutzia sp. R25]MEC4272939.1 hypothetical protein [Adlercreutzia sp. R25]
MREYIVKAGPEEDGTYLTQFPDPLVRCGDCNWADETPEGGMPKCGKLHRRVPRDGYCHMGERGER